MKSYSINIDRTGTLVLSVSGLNIPDYRQLLSKFKENKINISFSGHSPYLINFKSNWEFEDSIKEIMKEVGISEHSAKIPMGIPHSSSEKPSNFIQVKSFDFGELEIYTTDYDYFFDNITKNIFRDRLSHNNKNSYIISNPDKELMHWYVKALESSGFNASPLNPIVNLVPSTESNKINPIIISDIPEEGHGPWDIRLKVKALGRNERISANELKRIISFLFGRMSEKLTNPATGENYTEVQTSTGLVFYIRGKYSEIKNLQLVLEKNGFNTYRMTQTIEELLKTGKLSKETLPGEVTGFSNEEELEKAIRNYELRFFSETDIPVEKRHFYQEQVKGIKFLFTRPSALLGDEVGVGKTLQTIIAADLKMKVSGGNCLIITKPAIISQLAIEISRITGDTDDLISQNWSNPSKWTIVSYNTFSDINLRKPATEFLIDKAKENTFSVCILDEIHMIKNGEPSKRHQKGYLDHGENHATFNVQEITQYIPNVWGASATIVANRPIDMLNQLRAINHPMGNMSHSQFLENFDDRESDVEQMRKADFIRDLLIDQGSYLRRSKKEVNPNMPNLNIEKNNITLSSGEVSSIMAGAPASPSIDQLTKIRENLAKSKVEMTLMKAKEILSQNKKIAVFTDFPSTTMPMIVEGLELICYSLFPGEKKKIATIVGGQSREDRKEIVKQFKKKDSEYMGIVISIGAGGTGLDFPNIVTDVIVNDFDWSPSDDSQSLGRFYRINSKEPVNVTYMIAENTIDKKFFDLLQEKKEIAERIQNLSNLEKEEIAANKGNVKELIFELRKKKYEEAMKMKELESKLPK